MNRRVLLLEPNYKNKFPPIGLMKLATYFRLRGDEVVFYKGDLKDFVINQITETCNGCGASTTYYGGLCTCSGFKTTSPSRIHKY